MAKKIIPVILSGGSGTRLWPWSREVLPKPFVPFFEKNLFEQTLDRAKSLGPILIVTSNTLKPHTETSLKKMQIHASVLYETVGRNTLPSIALATVWVLQKFGPETILAVLPADHWIVPPEIFQKNILEASQLAEKSYLVVLGASPSRPETGYGYIEKGAPLKGSRGFLVKKFHEKPNQSAAENYIRFGYLWNVGIFIGQAKTFAQHISNIQKPVWELAQETLVEGGPGKDVFPNMPNLSFDYGILEHLRADDLALLPAEFEWSDLGNWESLSLFSKDAVAKHLSIHAQNNIIFGPPNKQYVLIGAQDLIVADTEDALLICHKNETQSVSQAYQTLKKQNPQVVERHTFEQRPWGEFKNLMVGEGFKAKIITVLPGEQLSYQSHQHRSEHWVIAQGEAEVILDGQSYFLKKGDYIFVNKGQKHRLKNPGQNILKVIEVQIGDHLDENDIIRYQDDYGRSIL